VVKSSKFGLISPKIMIHSNETGVKRKIFRPKLTEKRQCDASIW